VVVFSHTLILPGRFCSHSNLTSSSLDLGTTVALINNFIINLTIYLNSVFKHQFVSVLDYHLERQISRCCAWLSLVMSLKFLNFISFLSRRFRSIQCLQLQSRRQVLRLTPSRPPHFVVARSTISPSQEALPFLWENSLFLHLPVQLGPLRSSSLRRTLITD
jgi:hypothetical protein